MLNRHIHYLLALLLIILSSGCLSKPDLPGQRPGSLTVEIRTDENTSNNNDIQLVKAALIMEDDKLEQERTVSYNGTNTNLHFEKVYPGQWSVSVFALDSANDTIFQGNIDTPIASDQENRTVVKLSPAAASIRISFDASPVPDIGNRYNRGRFGVYLNPSSNRATYYDLFLEQNLLCGFIKKIPEGNFQAKICIPNATSPIFTTNKFKIDLKSGKTSNIHVKPDGTVITNPMIESWPQTPTGFNILPQNNRVTINWESLNSPQINGYHIYRTNSDGYFVLISTLDERTSSFEESISKRMAYKNHILYAICSYDSSGYESLWSESKEVRFD